ncbi:MAG: septal ring lytic transglycosylase RlpA family protein [Actinomycetota bacterium]|nr:septal ring lytic transglycosylase RlpA family protein [Actinomycetota bacterium]
MRPSRTMRKWRPVHVTAGALMLAVPGSAYALAAKPTDTRGVPANSVLRIALAHDHVTYGTVVSVTGTAGQGASRQRVELELQPAGASNWRVLSSAPLRGDGSFRLRAPLRTSGQVRVVPAATAPVRASIVTSTTPTTTPNGPAPRGSTVLSPSASQPVTVAAKLRVPNRPVGVLGRAPAHIRGTLLPARSGRRVTLLGRSGRRWHRLASARTGHRGGFDLRLAAGGQSSQPLQVRFAGDRYNARIATGAGRLTVFTAGVASWYSDGGATGCGFHAQYGVANKSLPCGTHVTFRYGGRTVTATVDDRGPFVGGREWDLNQNTAAALGFGGVGTVWASY